MPVEGWQRLRPIRVAFLVPLAVTHAQLDAIFDFSHGIWGGRFSPIGTVRNGTVSQEYRAWLNAYDPDYLVSFARLSVNEHLRLYRENDPAKIVQLDDKVRVRANDIAHQLQVTPLSSLSTLAVGRDGFPPERLQRRIFDVLLRNCDRSIIDSFGSFRHSFSRYPFPAHLAQNGVTATYVDEGAAKNPYDLTRPTGVLIHTVEDAWAECLKGGYVGLTQYASMECPRIELGYGHHLKAFQLIVGDTPTDRLLFWNTRGLFDRWKDGSIVALRINTNDADNPSLLALLSDFLKNRNPIINEGSGGTREVDVRSTSLTAEQISTIVEKLKPERGFVRCKGHGLQKPYSLLPASDVLAKAVFDSPWLGKYKANWREFSFDGKLALLPSEIPSHLKGVGTEPLLASGAWATDIRLNRAAREFKNSEVMTWQLSRRLRMADAFTIRIQPPDIPSGYLEPGRRIVNGGALTTFATLEAPILSIETPTDEWAFRHALAWVGAGVPSKHYPPLPKAPGARLESSDKGDHLRGLLGVFGDLPSAAGMLVHGFWQESLKDWACTTAANEGNVDTLMKRLKAKFPDGLSGGEDELRRVAEALASKVREMRMPKRTIPYSVLAERWRQYRADFWAKTKQVEKGKQSRKHERREAQTLDDCLNRLTAQGALFQGLMLGCPNCRHDNWVPINELDTALPCRVCHETIKPPMLIDWEFMISGFIQEALSEHGLHAVIWALYWCKRRARSSFLFEGCSNFWTTKPRRGKHDTDIDLSVLVDGRSYIFEVKTSWAQLKPRAKADFVKLMQRIQPDVAVMAVMDNPSQHRRNALQAELTERLAKFGTAVEVWTLGDHPFDEAPYLS